MLLFRSEENVKKWCESKSLPMRPLINLEQVWSLARRWYENRLTVESSRPKPDEIVPIFTTIGLTGPFWDPFHPQS